MNGIGDIVDNDSEQCKFKSEKELFKKSELLATTVVASDKYILYISATSETNPTVATCLSDFSCEIYGINNNQVAKITTLAEHTDKLVDCRFSNDNNSLLYTCSNDGNIKLWDIRTPNASVATFTDTTVENQTPKCLSCFDVSPNGKLLTAGTDLYLGEPFLLFWDIRNKNLLGGYWESHTDDITQVKFNNEDSNQLISGSTDGLINVFDLSQTSEDDALIDTFNTESSVGQLLCFKEKNRDKIGCVTHTEDLQLWDVTEADLYKNFSRQDIAVEIKEEEDDTYIIGFTPTTSSQIVFAGSKSHPCLRSVKIVLGQSESHYRFEENSQIVRSTWMNENTGIILTGGENGVLDVWKL